MIYVSRVQLARVICPSGGTRDVVFGRLSSPFRKNISVFPKCKSGVYLALSRLTEGRLAIVTDARRDAVDADGADDERRKRRTAKSCGPDAPTLASSLREATFAGDGGKKARSPGRARYKP